MAPVSGSPGGASDSVEHTPTKPWPSTHEPLRPSLGKPKALQQEMANLDAGDMSGTSTHDALYELSQRLSHRITELEDEVATLREEREALRTENEVIGEHVYGLQKENGMLHDMGMTSFLEKAQLARKAEDVGSEITRLKLGLSQQEEKNKTLTAENARLRSVVEALRAEKSHFQHSAKGLQATLDSLQSDLSGRIGMDNANQQRCVMLERQVKDLQAEKGRLDHIVSGQHVEIAQKQQLVAELQAEKANNHALTQRLETADMEITRCYQEKAELDRLISTLHVESAQMKTQRDSALAEVPLLKDSLSQQGTLVVDLQGELSQLQQNIADLQRQNARIDRERKSYSLALEKTRSQTLQYEQAMAMLHDERTRLHSTLEMLNAGKAEIDSRLSTTMTEKGLMQSHFEQTRAEKEQLRVRCQQAAAENSALRSRIVGLEKMLQGYKDEAAATQERLRVANMEKEQLQKQQLQPTLRSMVPPALQGLQGVPL
eukprot:CAMPEP_0176063472 /NCGR_PEP_ID=MMETSP0120_2-20121206/31656_1 /TAXON_ID=160619 /ORGANISM="Kryptoperidinium foliaceum, Strain CCMP 1326" /LENGTH=488 /DNA_ID=CAMNT_0017397045 /DNA_START=74 /DNA_END=1540 /DNA_ORIENTATION=+